jgi:hypothetical protein
MGHRWKDYEEAAEHGPVRLALKVIKTIVLFLLVLVSIAAGVNYGCRWISNAGDTAFRELSPSAMLKKYEWFKDASAQLDKKQADIRVYDARLTSLAEAYKGEPRSKWPRDDREQHSLWSSESAGVRASFNSLAAEYNAQMAKINWAFCNVGQLPAGANVPLPREYKPYVTE